MMQSPRPVTAAISRRMLLAGIAATPIAAMFAARPLRAAQGAQAVLVSLADLHSPYARLPALLAEIEALRAEVAPLPVAVLINGDIFERGNVVAVRSGGAPDWAFLAALAARGPVVLNLGNHETALLDDLSLPVARATALGITVIGNVLDRRTGRFFAPASARLGLGGLRLGLLGLAPTNPFVWRAPVRDSLGLLDPVAFARDTMPALAATVDAPILMSHAGVTADRAILPGLPEGTLTIGSHDHLAFQHDDPVRPYFHGGSWAGAMTVVFAGGGSGWQIETRAVAPVEGDAALRALVDKTLAEHLTEAEREVIAVRDRPLDLPASILLATEAVRAAADADIAFLGHTTFGAPLDQGPLTRYDFDAFVRFDGDIRVAEIPGPVLAAILERANQHRATSLDGRTGDYVHAAQIDIDPARSYRVAVNGWTARNQRAYLGTEDIDFAPVEGLMLKAVVADALAQG